MTAVYVLLESPYHDNETLSGVYRTEAEGVAALRAAANPADFNSDDYYLTEWDLDADLPGRVWYLRGKQVFDPARKDQLIPIYRDYTIEFPDGTAEKIPFTYAPPEKS